MAEIRIERASHNSPVRLASGLNMLVAVWVIISPWVYGHSDSVASVWNSVIVGILIALCAVSRYSSPATVWPSWVNVLLGIWLIISPWIYGYVAHTARVWNSVILGIIVILLGVWGIMTSRLGTAMA